MEELDQQIEVVGVNRFILLFRIDDLADYSKNHYEIVDPRGPAKDMIIQETGNRVIVNPEQITCGGTNNTISDYNFFVLNRELKMLPENALFVPENMQFVILLRKSIPWTPTTFRIVNERVIRYIAQRVPKFLEATTNGLYTNIKYEDFIFDPLP